MSEAIEKTEVQAPNDQAAEKFHLVARDPQQMAAAQSNMAVFLQKRIFSCTQEADELHLACEEAKKHKWKTSTLLNQKRRAVVRKEFYEKCLAAVQAGFTIIPNIPVDLFAIRVTRENPAAPLVETKTESSWQFPRVRDEVAQVLPVGEGRYESPKQLVYNTKEVIEENGKKMIVRQQWATDFDDITFPLIAAVPEVMNATQQAMALRIFDQIGVSPQRTVQRRGDPLIIGQILGVNNGWQRKTISFLIAWHLDLRTL